MTGATIVDYGTGNFLSVCRAFQRLGVDIGIAEDAGAIEKADRLVLPGVGAFGACARSLHERRLFEPMRAFQATGRPFFGICVGMQMLMDGSEEFGWHDGFGIIPGRVSAIPDIDAEGKKLKIPHIGWQTLKPGDAAWERTPLAGVGASDFVYFVHSFAAVPDQGAHILAHSDHGGRQITAALKIDNMFGAQFHPEKSGPVGLRIIEKFLEL